VVTLRLRHRPSSTLPSPRRPPTSRTRVSARAERHHRKPRAHHHYDPRPPMPRPAASSPSATRSPTATASPRSASIHSRGPSGWPRRSSCRSRSSRRRGAHGGRARTSGPAAPGALRPRLRVRRGQRRPLAPTSTPRLRARPARDRHRGRRRRRRLLLCTCRPISAVREPRPSQRRERDRPSRRPRARRDRRRLGDLAGSPWLLPDAVHPTALGQLEIADRAARPSGPAVDRRRASRSTTPLAPAPLRDAPRRVARERLRRRGLERITLRA
jgi:hypothetical protein